MQNAAGKPHNDYTDVSIQLVFILAKGGNAMGISISAKNDYSYLFSSLNKSSGSGSVADMSWLSDYTSIKSGSYGKLLKAYYASDSDKTDEKSKSAVTKLAGDTIKQDETSKIYSTAATKADALQKSVDAVSSLKEDADDDAKFKAVESYVKSYNDLVDAAAGTADKSITNRLTSIETATGSAEKKLNSIGISIESDGKLKLNKDTFMAADKSAMNELFAKKGSYASSVNVSAAMIQSSANFDAARGSAYDASGSYQAVTGSLWDSTM